MYYGDRLNTVDKKTVAKIMDERPSTSPINCEDQSLMIRENLHPPRLVPIKRKQGDNKRRKRKFFQQQTKITQQAIIKILQSNKDEFKEEKERIRNEYTLPKWLR